MKQQLLLFLCTTFISLTAADMTQEIHIAPLELSSPSQKALTQTQQIFREIAATKYVLEKQIREKATGCSHQTYFDFSTGAMHQEYRNAIGVYDIIFNTDGSIEIDTKYIKEKAAIVQELNLFWFKRRLQSDVFSRCMRSGAVYAGFCKTELTPESFATQLHEAEQAIAIPTVRPE